MNKRLIMILIAISIFTLIFAMAPNPPPPTYDCSPGFWKTHSIYKYQDNRFWSPYLPSTELPGSSPSISLWDALHAKGGAGSGKDLRYAAADFLNTAPGTFCPD